MPSTDAEFAGRLQTELDATRAEVERLRKERDDAVTLYNIGATLASEDEDTSALVLAHREAERLREENAGCRENLHEARRRYTEQGNQLAELERLREEKDWRRSEVERLPMVEKARDAAVGEAARWMTRAEDAEGRLHRIEEAARGRIPLCVNISAVSIATFP